jgi:hypothetical protein
MAVSMISLRYDRGTVTTDVRWKLNERGECFGFVPKLPKGSEFGQAKSNPYQNKAGIEAVLPLAQPDPITRFWRFVTVEWCNSDAFYAYYIQ